MATLAKLIVSIGANSAEFTTELKKVQSQLKAFQKSTKDLDAVMNPIGTALKAVGVAAVAAFSAGGAAALASGQIIEKYRMSLTTLMGSSQAAGQAVANALNLASKTPFTDDQLLAATVALTKFGQNAQAVLPQVANMAAATNGDVEQAAQAYGAFLQGRVKALQSFGITKAQVLAEGAKTEAGIEIANQKGTIVNQAAFNTALLSLMDKRFKAGAELQANSLGGLIKGMKDTGEDILRTIAGFSDDGTVRAGSMFDFFKQGITAVLAKVEEWKANGSLQKWADDVGQAITVFFTKAKTVFNWMVDIGTWIAKNWDAITPVLGAVLGAFLAFKVVTGVVDGIAIAVAALKDILIVTNGVLALTPIGAIMLAVAALTAVVVIVANAWRDYNAAMNPKLTTNASTDNIQALRTKLDQFDKDTAKNLQVGKESAEWTQDQIASYEAARAKDRLVIQQQLQNNIDGVRGSAMDKQGKAQTDAIAKQKKDADAAAAAIAAAEKQQRDAKTAAEKTAADKVMKAAQAQAEAVLKVNADLNDQIYKLSHTTVEGQIYDLAKARDAAIADGGSKLKADEAYTLAAKKVYDDARIAKAAADKDATDKAAAAAKDAQDKYLALVVAYTAKQKDVYSMLTQTIIDNYSVQKNAAVSAIEKERDSTVNALDDMIDKRQDELNSTLDAISQEKAAVLGQYDAQIQALEDAHAAAQRVETVTGLRADVANAATPEELARAQKALSKELADNAYNDKLDSLRKQKQAASDTYDAETKVAQSAADRELQTLKDSVTAVQVSYADRLTSVQSYYDALMLQRNAEAEAEKDLAGTTQTDIITMLQNRLAEWKGLGTQIGDSMYSGLQSALGAFASLGSTANPVIVAANAANVASGFQSPSFLTPRAGAIPHANGGYFTTPHIGMVAEHGPEAIVPQSQFSAFANQMGGGNSDSLLRAIGLKLDTLIGTTRSVGPSVGNAINGLARR